jgi:hypothetical protein
MPKSRKAAAASLYRLGSQAEANVDGLRRATNDESCAVRAEAAKAMTSCGLQGLYALLKCVAYGSYEAVVPAASYGADVREPVWKLYSSASSKAKELLISVLDTANQIYEHDWPVMLSDSDWTVLFRGIQALEHCDIPDSVVPQLAALLDRYPDPALHHGHAGYESFYKQNIDRRIREILTRLGVRALPAAEALLRYLKRDDDHDSYIAADALAAIGPDVLPLLLRELESPNIRLSPPLLSTESV